MISIVIPTYNRPQLLKVTLASIASQNLSFVGEILIGDNTTNEAMREANRVVVETSECAHLIDYTLHQPSKNYTANQCFLGAKARFEQTLLLHDDDFLCEGAVESFANACAQETDPRVKVWFGRNYIANEDGSIDLDATVENDKKFGKDGPEQVHPMWHWCLSHSLPPDGFLIDSETNRQTILGTADGNVPDWAQQVRLANAGVWARFIPKYVAAYRVFEASQTQSGRGMDVHRLYEISRDLKVPPEQAHSKTRILREFASVATVRYLRDDQRIEALKCFLSNHWSWSQRLSRRGAAILLMLITPKRLWLNALKYRD